ncbi:ISAs1 family transposase [Desulfococcaceae bacterium HSG9]|nr:ISAs1 family transposase [Desulfococcaceae bacterium HSG9]
MTPKTTAQIHQAGGCHLTQVKENQPVLPAECKKSAAEGTPAGSDIDTEKGHGRVTVRRTKLYSMRDLKLHKRWAGSGLRTLAVMERETFEPETIKTGSETSYYITCQEAANSDSPKEPASAVRKHWGVESDNRIRDVTLKEDKVIMKSGNQAQIMSTLHSLAMRFLRKSEIKNFQEAIERWTDCTDKFESMLRRLKFL